MQVRRVPVVRVVVANAVFVKSMQYRLAPKGKADVNVRPRWGARPPTRDLVEFRVRKFDWP